MEYYNPFDTKQTKISSVLGKAKEKISSVFSSKQSSLPTETQDHRELIDELTMAATLYNRKAPRTESQKFEMEKAASAQIPQNPELLDMLSDYKNYHTELAKKDLSPEYRMATIVKASNLASEISNRLPKDVQVETIDGNVCLTQKADDKPDADFEIKNIFKIGKNNELSYYGKSYEEVTFTDNGSIIINHECSRKVYQNNNSSPDQQHEYDMKHGSIFSTVTTRVQLDLNKGSYNENMPLTDQISNIDIKASQPLFSNFKNNYCQVGTGDWAGIKTSVQKGDLYPVENFGVSGNIHPCSSNEGQADSATPSFMADLSALTVYDAPAACSDAVEFLQLFGKQEIDILNSVTCEAQHSTIEEFKQTFATQGQSAGMSQDSGIEQ